MRISTNQFYNQNLRSLMDNQSKLSDTQEALSTGKKLNRPSDDPVGAAKVVRLTEELDKLTQYQRNNDFLIGSLEQQETVLDGITSAVDRARVLTIQSGSGAITDNDRAALGSELKEIRDELLDLMNSKDANGQYIYSGHQSDTPAFSIASTNNGNIISYAGDAGKNFVNVSDNSKIQSTSSGFDVFENVLARLEFEVNPTGTATVNDAQINSQDAFDRFHSANFDNLTPANNNFELTVQASGEVELTNSGTGASYGTVPFTSGQPFTIEGMEFTVTGGVGDTVDFSLQTPEKKNLAQTVNDLYEVLSTPGLSQETYQKALDDTLIGLDNGLQKVALERSSVGGRMNAAQSSYSNNLDLEVVTKAARSAIEDVDYAEASVEFSKQEAALNATLATFPKLSNLSLFDYI